MFCQLSFLFSLTLVVVLALGFKATASIKMREIDPSHVKEFLPARW